jgi:drug/metabolite transporter (DMT)-like permease
MSLRKLLAYGAIYVLWGGSFLAIRILVAHVPPFFAAGSRMTLAGLVLVAYSHLRGAAQYPKYSIRNASALGFLMFTVMYAALFWGEVRVSSGIAAVISAMIPVWIFAGEVVLLRTQKVTVPSIAGILLGFAGVVVLAGGSRTASGGRASALAIAVMAGGTLCWAGGTLWSRRLALPKPPTASAGWQMATGGALLLLLSVAIGEMRHVPGAEVLLRVRILACMAYLVIAASILAYTAYVWLIEHEPASRVASYAYVNPVIALIAGALLADERLSALQLLGVLLVLAGVLVTLRARRPVPDTRTVSRKMMA